MKKLSFLAVALTAMIFAACGGNKTAQTAENVDTVKSFEQQQLEASIKQNFDSLASEIGKLKQLPIRKKDGMITLTEEEMQVKPNYLLEPGIAEETTTLAEKYRVLSAMQVDKEIADLYGMSTQEYENEIAKLLVDINDPSFKSIENTDNIYEATEELYNAMDENGRINFFWQIVATSLVEQLYVISQNTDKFLTAFDDDAASNVSLRVILIQDAINRLTQYDPEIIPVAEAFDPLTVINATNVPELKSQLDSAKDQIAAARNSLLD